MQHRFEIQVEVNNKKYILDIFDADPITTNYQVSDIRDPLSIDSDYTRTIKLPNSKINREAFQYISDLTSSSSYNPNKKAKCWVMVDSIVQLEGSIQLKNVIKNFDSYVESLECVIYGGVNTFVKSLGERFLSDLQMSNYNHVWGPTAIANSWTQSYANGYYYGLMDYGQNFVYSSTQSALVLDTDDFYPQTYVRTIWNQMFTEAGYQYKSTWMDTNPTFNNLLIPYNRDYLYRGPSSSNELGFIAGMTANQTFSDYINLPVGLSTFTLSFPQDINDPNNLWFNNYYLVPSFQLKQIFVIELEIEELYPSLGFLNYFGILNIYSSSDPGTSLYGLTLQKNIIGFNGTNPIYRVSIKSNPLGPFTPGDHIFFTITPSYPAPVGTPMFRVYANTTQPSTYSYGSRIYNLVESTILPGQLIDYNQVLPQNIKQKDFFLWICKMFNLQVEKSKEYPNTLLIEPYDEYYANGTVKDWSDKIDLNQDISSQILGETQNRTTIFKYKDGKDFLNTDYKNKTNQSYGEYRYELDNDFIDGETKVEVGFESTPLSSVENSLNLVIPKIQKPDQSVGFTDTGIKILMKNSSGMINTFGSDKIRYNGVVYIKYPYVGNVDNPFNPTIDINFGQTKGLYYPQNMVTNNNLFWQYWKSMTDEISDRDSRIITFNAYLSPSDIYQLRFNDKIYIGISTYQGYYKLNKISNYDPTKKVTCQIELIKSQFYTNPRNRDIRYGIQVDQSIRPPVFNVGGSKYGNDINASNTIALGKDNLVSNGAGGTIVQGSHNKVYSSNNTILGDNNNIDPSAFNSMVVGDNNNIDAINKNSLVIGDGNTINASNSGMYVFGDNINATQSGLYTNNLYVTNINGLSVSNVIQDLENVLSVGNTTGPYDIIFNQNIIGSSSSSFGSGNFIGGRNNAVNSLTGSVVGGIGNTVYGSGDIIGGFFNTSGTSTFHYGNFIGGQNNQVNGHSNIVNGIQNGIISSTGISNGNIVSGSVNSVYSQWSLVIGNAIELYNNEANIVSGALNILGTGSSYNNVSGAVHILTASTYNTISGNGNDLSDSSFNSVGGTLNTLNATSSRNIVSGTLNILTHSTNNIVGGSNNKIIDSDNNNIVGGNHQISSSGLNTISGNGNDLSNSSYNNVGGLNNNLSNSSSNEIIGNSNIIDNCQSSFIGGRQNTHSGIDSSLIISLGMTGSDVDNSIVSGLVGNLTGITSSLIIGGAALIPIDLNNQTYLINVGSNLNSYGSIICSASTTNATPTITLNNLIIPSNKAYAVDISVIAAVRTSGSSKEWSGRGIIKNVAGTTTLVAAISLISVSGDVALTTASITVAANNTNDTLEFTATGVAATNINWTCRVDYSFVDFS